MYRDYLYMFICILLVVLILCKDVARLCSSGVKSGKPYNLCLHLKTTSLPENILLYLKISPFTCTSLFFSWKSLPLTEYIFLYLKISAFTWTSPPYLKIFAFIWKSIPLPENLFLYLKISAALPVVYIRLYLRTSVFMQKSLPFHRNLLLYLKIYVFTSNSPS